VCTAPGYPLFHIANSMSARHANLFVGPRETPQRVFMNRGVNGIDGNVSTFLGELAGTRIPGLLLIGDQAMVHDMNALEAARTGGTALEPRYEQCFLGCQVEALQDLAFAVA
jgi:2-succinyl-5-enolpyruvyl-6-hydroxy-3-cyclohexene-1-carboxylate synthase